MTVAYRFVKDFDENHQMLVSNLYWFTRFTIWCILTILIIQLVRCQVTTIQFSNFELDRIFLFAVGSQHDSGWVVTNIDDGILDIHLWNFVWGIGWNGVRSIQFVQFWVESMQLAHISFENAKDFFRFHINCPTTDFDSRLWKWIMCTSHGQRGDC